MNSQDRYRILSNIVSQKGTDNVDLYAELAKAESMVNLMDTQKAMSVVANNTPTAQPTTPPNVQPM
jgi:hypothetical protein